MSKTLILGGVKSGKSRLAEELAIASQQSVTYIATAAHEDHEMQARIQQHRQRRPQNWHTVETRVLLVEALEAHCRENECVLIDCLTMWLTNLLMTENEQLLHDELSKLQEILPQLPGTVIFVSNETSMGVIPMGELTRRFCDEAGQLHQQLARQADRVILTIAGLPHVLKGNLSGRY